MNVSGGRKTPNPGAFGARCGYDARRSTRQIKDKASHIQIVCIRQEKHGGRFNLFRTKQLEFFLAFIRPETGEVPSEYACSNVYL